MTTGHLRSALLACFLAATAGCGDDVTPGSKEPAEPSVRTTGRGPSAPGTPLPPDAEGVPTAGTAAGSPETGPAPTGVPGTPGTPAATGAPPAGAPTDPQIAAILVAANDADIATAKLAKRKSKDPAVLAFADQMIADHEAANEKVRKLLTGAERGLEPSETSRAMAREHDATMQRLAALEGAAFDRAYVEQEVLVHGKVLDTIDRALVPSARAPELAAVLAEVRPVIDAHLAHARKLQEQLGTDAAPTH